MSGRLIGGFFGAAVIAAGAVAMVTGNADDRASAPTPLGLQQASGGTSSATSSRSALPPGANQRKSLFIGDARSIAAALPTLDGEDARSPLAPGAYTEPKRAETASRSDESGPSGQSAAQRRSAGATSRTSAPTRNQPGAGISTADRARAQQLQMQARQAQTSADIQSDRANQIAANDPQARNIPDRGLPSTIDSSNSAGGDEGASNDPVNENGIPQSVLDRIAELIGGGGSGSGNGGSSGGSGSGSNGGGGGGGGTVTAGTPTPDSADLLLLPATIQSCAELDNAGAVTLDLFVRFDSPGRVLSLSTRAAGTTQITPLGGEFIQDPAGGNTPPSNAQVQADTCLAFDTFLDANGGTVLLPGQAPTYSPGLSAEWAVFPFDSAAIQDENRFGDSGYYFRAARFTLTSTTYDLVGDVQVTFQGGAGSAQRTQIITLAECVSCYPADPPTTGGGNGGNGGNNGGNNGGGDGGNNGGGDGGNNGGGDGGNNGGGDGGNNGGGDGGNNGGGDGGNNGGGDGGNNGGSDGGNNGGGDGGNNGGGDTVEPNEDPVSLIWIEIDNEDCADDGGFSGIPSDITDTRTFRLYFRAEEAHTVISVGAGPTATTPVVAFSPESPYQHPIGDNKISLTVIPAILEQAPCLAFDSYLAIGVGPINFALEPPIGDWGQELTYAAFTFGVTTQQDEDIRGDDDFYALLMQVTLPDDATIQGQLRPFYREFGTGVTQMPALTIPPFPAPTPPPTPAPDA